MEYLPVVARFTHNGTSDSGCFVLPVEAWLIYIGISTVLQGISFSKSDLMSNKTLQSSTICLIGRFYNRDGVCLLRGTNWIHSQILRSAHAVYLCVLCGSEENTVQHWLWFILSRRCVFTARYEVNVVHGRPEFDNRLVYMGFVVDKVALSQFLFEFFSFS
jgi:hypothetical protein